ncbi:MAG TPA: hypothetical protein VG757_05480, partial [Devosia sp.]|nr:hypothetical protein [Devosia sp.]
ARHEAALLMRKRSGFPSSEEDYKRLNLDEIDVEIARLEQRRDFLHQKHSSASLRKDVEESLHRLGKYRARLVADRES